MFDHLSCILYFGTRGGLDQCQNRYPPNAIKEINKTDTSGSGISWVKCFLSLSMIGHKIAAAKMSYNYADIVLAIPAVIGLIVIGYLVLLMFRIYLIERYIIQSFMQTNENLDLQLRLPLTWADAGDFTQKW